MKRENVLVSEDALARQREFEEKIRGLFAAREAHPAACVDTFGCQQNVADGQKLMGMLEASGFTLTQDPKEADLVLLNTCAIREHAEDRVFGNLGALTHTKKENPEQVICLCGCMAQEERVSQRVKESYRHVDLVFGPHALWKFPELLWQVYETRKRVFAVDNEDGTIAEGIPVVREKGVKAWVSIMYGCNNFCTYCVVPLVRGRERSRSSQDVLREAREIVAAGYKEIMLLGQNVNSYGKTLEQPMTFAALLREVEKIDGIQRIRFMTSHPKDLSDELIETMRDSKKICRHLHLPLQSGSTRVQGLMNRRYTKESYLALAEKLKREIPDLSLTTDIIVGFPGETEEDFQDTLDVVRRVRYDSAFTFLYSKRSGTPAAAMEGQIPDDVAHERFNRLLKEVQHISAEMTGRFEGETQPVLVEEVNGQHPELMTGKLSNNITVHFPGTPDLIGKIVPVYLKKNCGFYYMGELR